MKLLGLAVAPLLLGVASAEPAATLTLSPGRPGPEIPAHFSGLSFEIRQVRAEADGSHYFNPENRALVALFRTLGIRSLRVGGNTSDRDVRQLPDTNDIDSLFAFARSVDATVIYCLQLRHADPKADLSVVKYIEAHYASQIECFSLGQEPSAYPVETTDGNTTPNQPGAEKYPYPLYRAQWKAMADAIVAEVPEVKFCGPSVHNNGEWTRSFIGDFGRNNHVSLITEHLYPGGPAGKVASPEAGRDRMLGPDFVEVCQKLYDGFVPTAEASGLPYRLEEVNSYYNGGAANVSNTFAATLWGLDFLHWWASHGAEGINIHSGDNVAAGKTLLPAKYTPYASTNHGFEVRALGYGIKAFKEGSGGRSIPAEISGNAGHVNLSAYCVMADDGGAVVTIINKEHGPSARTVPMRVAGLSGAVRTMALIAPKGDVSATTDITLGGSRVSEDGSWNGTWREGPTADAAGTILVDVPPASALLIKCGLR